MSRHTFQKSSTLLKRALQVTPAGAQTYSKSHRYFSGGNTPYFLDHGRAGHVWDVDGNEFIDFILALGPVTIGYNNPEINEAVMKQIEKGVSFSQPTCLEIELAEKIIEAVPCAEMVRFLKNGSDATTAAVRIARAATGRDMVAVCGYHGMHDWYIGSTHYRNGVPGCVCDLSVSFTYNNPESLEDIFSRYPGRVAAVILEPVQACGPENGFLNRVKELAAGNGAVLVFDEIVSGFRIALGGAQEYYGVVPDMAALGKGMANGFPLSALVGRRELLEHIARGVFISTTFGGETLSLAAALKTIEILSRPGSFEHIWALAERYTEKAARLVAGKNLESAIFLSGLPPHSGLLCSRVSSLDPEDLFSVLQQRLIAGGILTLGINNFCLEHTDKDVDCYLRVLDAALDDVRDALAQGTAQHLLTGPKTTPFFKRN